MSEDIKRVGSNEMESEWKHHTIYQQRRDVWEATLHFVEHYKDPLGSVTTTFWILCSVGNNERAAITVTPHQLWLDLQSHRDPRVIAVLPLIVSFCLRCKEGESELAIRLERVETTTNQSREIQDTAWRLVDIFCTNITMKTSNSNWCNLLRHFKIT